MVVPGVFFEELGITYLGPIDGHNLEDLIVVLQKARHIEGPVLIHVMTQKGKGYPPAMENPDRFHGIGPFDVTTGKPFKSGTKTYTQVFGEFMVRKAAEEESLVAITAAMTSGTGLDQFAREYPERFFDVGIAEQHGVTFAAGLATEGMIPVVAIYSSFLQRAYDQILHDVCLQNLPVVFALDRSGFVGEDGPTHHGLFDLSFLRPIPNMIVMAPKDENELQSMLFSAMGYGRPVAIRYPRGSGIGVSPDAEPTLLEIGKGELLADGTDVAILAIGSTVYPALAASEKLAKEGISAAVVNARFVKPLDRQLLLDLSRSFKHILTVEENAVMGGFGSAVLECFEENGIRDLRIKRLGVRDEFAQQATQAELRDLYGIDEQGIVAAVLAMMDQKKEREPDPPA